MIVTTMATIMRTDGGKGRDADDCACCGWMEGGRRWMMGVVTGVPVAMLRARRGTAEERHQERGKRGFHWRGVKLLRSEMGIGVGLGRLLLTRQNGAMQDEKWTALGPGPALAGLSEKISVFMYHNNSFSGTTVRKQMSTTLNPR